MSDSGTSTRGDRIFRDLELEIVSGRLEMGAKLGEEALAARFGVSRGPLREALRRLEGGGLVVRLPHLGVRVVTLSRQDLLEIYQTRELLEGLAARLAAERMTDEELNAMKELLHRHYDSTSLKEGQVYPQAFGEEDFHFRIAQGSRSMLLQRLLCGELYSLIRLCRFKTAVPGQLPQFRDHVRIMDAIYERDGELAEILMRRHVASARERLMRIEANAWPEAVTRKTSARTADLRSIRNLASSLASSFGEKD